ncbi:MAG TPA: hypothetical protein VEN31_07670 [Candidatus Bathyarchaeia archaeon]|nr:hypothetical protein [Candidatus Bathyarchaeia archaeon]
MGNLLLRVGFALSIVAAAIGMTFAAPNNFGRSDAASPAPAASVTPVVAGYQAAPLPADSASALSTSSTQGAATLVALATTIVLLAIFVILFSYRPRPGGVRASHR